MEGRGNETGRIYGDKPFGLLRHVTRSCGRPQQLPSCFWASGSLDFRRTHSNFSTHYQWLTRRDPDDPHPPTYAFQPASIRALNAAVRPLLELATRRTTRQHGGRRGRWLWIKPGSVAFSSKSAGSRRVFNSQGGTCMGRLPQTASASCLATCVERSELSR
jgi:hypothetical protein